MYQRHILRHLNRVCVLWVPKHIGIEVNEIADKLVKKAASITFIGPESLGGLGNGEALSSLAKLGIYQQERCRFCRKDNETARHILERCTALMHQHEIYLGDPLMAEKRGEIHIFGLNASIPLGYWIKRYCKTTRVAEYILRQQCSIVYNNNNLI